MRQYRWKIKWNECCAEVSLFLTNTITGYFRSLGHNLTLNISKTMKIKNAFDIFWKLAISNFYGMFKDVECEHCWSHSTDQADSPILAKYVPALRCRCLQQFLLFRPSFHPHLMEGEAHWLVLSQTPTKRNRRMWDLETWEARAWEGNHPTRPSSPSVW